MEESALPPSVAQFSEDVKKYLELQAKYQALNTSEKMASAGSFIIWMVIFTVFLVFTLMFLVIFAAVYLSEHFGTIRGFGYISIAALGICVVLIVLRKSIQRFFFNLSAKVILSGLKSTDDE